MSEGHGGAKRDSAARLERDACILGHSLSSLQVLWLCDCLSDQSRLTCTGHMAVVIYT